MTDISFKSPRLESGSALWLAFNQLKREFRMRQNNSGAKAIIGRMFFAGIILFAIFGAGISLKTLYNGDFNLGYGFYLAAGHKLMGLFAGLLFMSLMSAFMYFSDRGDLDLLLSSPLNPKDIATGRILVSTFRTFLMFLMFGAMFIGYTAISSNPELFTFIPVAIGLALFEGGVGFFLARFLLLKFGLVKGRRISQILGFGGIAGGIFYMQTSRLGHMSQEASEIFAYHGNYDLKDNILVWFGHALLGNWFNAFAIMLFGLGVFWFIMNLIGGAFADDAARISGQSELSQSSKRKSDKIKFSTNGWFVLLRKELLSIMRDPITIVQMIIPLVAFVPIFGMVFGKSDIEDGVLQYVFAPLTVFVTASMTSTLAWMVASVEEARDLLKSSPVKMAKIYLFKGITAFLPAFIEICILSIMLVKLGIIDYLIIIFFTLLANFSVILIEFANIKPTKRPKMMQKPDRAITSIIFVMILLLLWASAAGVAVYNFWFGILVALVAVIVNWFGTYGDKEGQENQIKSVWQKQLDSSKT
jgi:ABC-2 type transport system permease protein